VIDLKPVRFIVVSPATAHRHHLKDYFPNWAIVEQKIATELTEKK